MCTKKTHAICFLWIVYTTRKRHATSKTTNIINIILKKSLANSTRYRTNTSRISRKKLFFQKTHRGGRKSREPQKLEYSKSPRGPKGTTIIVVHHHHHHHHQYIISTAPTTRRKHAHYNCPRLSKNKTLKLKTNNKQHPYSKTYRGPSLSIRFHSSHFSRSTLLLFPSSSSHQLPCPFVRIFMDYQSGDYQNAD